MLHNSLYLGMNMSYHSYILLRKVVGYSTLTILQLKFYSVFSLYFHLLVMFSLWKRCTPAIHQLKEIFLNL